jgi:hypothetical protein
MMDGSLGEDAKTPLDFEDNVAVTKKVVDYIAQYAADKRIGKRDWPHIMNCMSLAHDLAAHVVESA